MSSFAGTMGLTPELFVPEQSPVDRTPELVIGEVSDDIIDEALYIEEASEQVTELVESMLQVQSEHEDLQLINPDNELAVTIALESLKGHFRDIKRRHGIDLTHAILSISKENFRGGVTSIGIENALFNIITDIWQAIKEAMIAVWDKLKDFWKKYFAEMTLVHKAIIRVEEAIKSRKGEIVHSEVLEANSKYNRMFAPDDKITPELIIKLLSHHDETSGVAAKFVGKAFDSMKQAASKDVTDAEAMDKFFVEVVDTVKEISGKETSAVILAGDDNPLAGFTTAKIDFDYGEAASKKSIKVRFAKDKTTMAEDDRQIVFGDRASLERLVSGMKKVYAATEKIGRDSEKKDREFRRLFETVTRKVTSDVKGSSEELNEVNNNAKFISELYKQYGGVIPKVDTFMTRLNLDLIKAVVAYINDSLSMFKVSGA